MVRELIVHVGDCKTGSTAIQTVLAKRLFEAEGRSLHYPGGLNHNALSKAMSNGTAEQAQAHATRIARELGASDADIGVISSETLEYVDPALLAALFEGPFKPWRDSVRLIGYIRPHAERFVASFGERTKKGLLSCDMDEFARRVRTKGLLFYTPRVTAWQAAFGERYTVRPYIRDSLDQGDVVRDFFAFVFGDAPVRLTAPTVANQTLSLEDLALLRFMQARIRSAGAEVGRAPEALGWNLVPFLTANPPEHPTKLRMHRALAQDFQATYAQDAADLDALVFDGTPMSDRLAKAADTAPELPQPLELDQHYPPEVIRIVEAQADFLCRLMAADPALFRWAARPEEFRAPLVEVLGRELKRHAPDALAHATSNRGAIHRLLRLPRAAERRLRDRLR